MLVDREGLIEPDAGHFPVTGGGVFAGRTRGAFAEGSAGRGGRGELFERRDVGEAQVDEGGDAQWARFRDMAEGASAGVVVVGGIRQGADADAVQYYPDDALKTRHAGTLLAGLRAL